MKRLLVGLLGVLMAGAPAEAYTSRQSRPVAVDASGIAEVAILDPVLVVAQGQGDTGATLGFGATGPNALRDSDEALRINLNTNLAGNRLIISTDNLSGTANPQAAVNTSTGLDGGGLVGVTDRSITVPLLWVIKDNNLVTDNHVFTTAAVGDDEVFIVDKAHVRTFVAAVSGQAQNGVLDNLATAFCSPSASHIVPPTNTVNDGLYPQYFGTTGQDQDICNASAGSVTIAGQVIPAGGKINVAEELNKNIAVVVFGCAGTACTAPDLTTPSGADSITVTSPFYLPLAADFRFAAGQLYDTNTLAVELITQ